MGVVNDKLRIFFYFVGFRIAKNPKVFTILPVILSLCLGSGLYFNFSYISNVEYLYTHSNGPSKIEKAQVEKYFFPNNHDAFDPSRGVRIGRFARVIITTKDDGTIIRSQIWNEIMELDRLIHNTTVKWNESIYQYENLCGKFRNACYENEFLDLGVIMDSIENGSIRLSYPVMFNPKTFNTHTLPQNFGGIEYSNTTFSATSIKALLLNYILAIDTPEDDSRGEAWEDAILEVLEKSLSDWKYIKVYRMTFKSLSREQEVNTFSTVPHFTVTIFFMGVFAFVTSMMTDCVRSKPWVSQMGIFSALLGTIAGFGILSHCGFDFIGLNMAIPFIMIGIGIDDTFVILASWRRTNVLDSVPVRLAVCYEEAAVSVTVTTLTDMMGFYVGVFTPIKSVQIFSLYAGTCVFCMYMWQLVFFGSMMAFAGYHEEKNKNALFLWKTAVPKSLSKNKSFLYKLFFAGGISKSDPENAIDNPDNHVMTFFRDSFSQFLNKTIVKILVVLVFAIYLSTSIWGIINLDEGLNRENLIRTDSYLSEYIQQDNKYFSAFPYRMQILVTTPLDYSTNETQEKITKLLDEFYNLEHVVQEYNENWLQQFTRFVENYKEFYNFNVSTEQEFIDTLENEFLESSRIASLDVAFNENKTKIIATRYILQSTNILGSNAERDLVVELRKIADSHEDLEVVVFNPWFPFIDQFIIVRELTYKLIAVAAAIVMLVAITFISNVVCSICVFLSIASIELGVLGFMSLWGVNLDMISLIFLIMCVGFSVDFAAHVAYVYISAKGKNSLERVEEALHSLGLPILQGAGSTIIGVIALVIVPSYIFQTMFKIVLLVIVFATFHGLFLLPVLLLIIKPETWKIFNLCTRSKKKFDVYHL